MSALEIIEARSKDEMADVRALREAVFVVEQNVPVEIEWDGLDGDARHLLARMDGVAVGTLRWRLLDGVGKIERVCVSKAARGTGLGLALMKRVLEELRQTDGVTRAKLGAQVAVLGFYEGLGFEAYGPIYDDAGIPHRDMAMDL